MNFLINFKKLFTIYALVQIFCSIGCFIQIEYVFDRYFAYEITTITTVEIPDETILPDLIIQVEVVRFINYTLFFQRFPSVGSLTYFRYNNTDQLLNSLRNSTLTDVVSEMVTKELTMKETTSLLYKVEDFIQTIYVRSMETMKIRPFNYDYTKRCQYKEYYQSIYFYIVVACSKEGPLTGSFVLSDLNPGVSDFFAVVMHREIALAQSRIQIAFIDANTLPNNRKMQWTRLQIRPISSVYATSFQIITLSLLPAPYSTCVNYSDEGYENRFEKLDECLNKLSQKRLNRMFYQCLHPADTEAPFVGFDQYLESDNATFVKISNDILTECEGKTMAMDCFEKNYNVKKPSAVKSMSSVSAIILSISKFPYIEMTSKPKLNVLDCAVSIGSIFGFWFGFALNVHIPRITRCIKNKLMKVRKEKSHKIGKHSRNEPVHRIKLKQLNQELFDDYSTFRSRESNRLPLKNSKRFTIN